MFDEATLKRIQDTAVAAHVPTQIRPSGLPNHQFFLHTPGAAKLDLYSIDPIPRAYFAYSVLGLVQQIRAISTGTTDRPVVMVGRNGITAFFDESTRRDTVRMLLEESDALEGLRNEGMSNLPQAELVWNLRSVYRNNVAPASFVPQIKQLKFTRDAASTGEVQQGRESMGRTVLMQVHADGDVPDVVEIRFRPYKNVNVDDIITECRIACAVRLHLEEGRITIRPLEGELETAVSAANQNISKWLREQLDGIAVVLEESTPFSGD